MKLSSSIRYTTLSGVELNSRHYIPSKEVAVL